MRILHTLSLLLALSLTARYTALFAVDAFRAVVHTTFVVPRKALTRRQRLIVVPQMVIGADSVVAELTPLVAARCQFSRKLHRRQVLEGYADPYSPMALHYDKQHVALLPYADTLHMPLPLRQVRLRAMLTTECGKRHGEHRAQTLCHGIEFDAVAPHVGTYVPLVYYKEQARLALARHHLGTYHKGVWCKLCQLLISRNR